MATFERCFCATIVIMAWFCFVTVLILGQSEHYSYSLVNPTMANFTTSRSQVYELNGDIRIQANSSTIYILAPTTSIVNDWTATPYARLPDRRAMAKSKSIKIVAAHHPRTAQRCRKFNVPAIVFSTGGYSGNVFHDFTDMLIPLYSTSRQFNRSVVFLVSDKRPWWTSKYRMILENLSKYDAIDIDNVNESLCFSRMIVGLKAHKGELGVDPSESPHHSISGFREFLRSTYSLERRDLVSELHRRRAPRLLFVSRRKTRHLTNEAQVAGLARSLGFDVDVREIGWGVSLVAKYVNSFDVMVGVHGAGLTNMVFLPDNGVVIQIVPVGLETLAKIYFKRPAGGMRLRYLEYNVSMSESTLMGNYRHPLEHKNGWNAFRSVYLDRQDVSVDLGRFRETLLNALELVRT